MNVLSLNVDLAVGADFEDGCKQAWVLALRLDLEHVTVDASDIRWTIYPNGTGFATAKKGEIRKDVAKWSSEGGIVWVD